MNVYCHARRATSELRPPEPFGTEGGTVSRERFDRLALPGDKYLRRSPRAAEHVLGAK